MEVSETMAESSYPGTICSVEFKRGQTATLEEVKLKLEERYLNATNGSNL